MKVTLISLHAEILSIGIRSLSACLKKAGHEVKLIFLIQEGWRGRKGADLFRPKYSEEVLSEVCRVCQNSDLVGLSFLTNYFFNAVSLTNRLKEEVGVSIIWGGIHPTVKSEECLDYVDIVCIGEGEEALVELVNKMDAGNDYYDTRNFWFREGKRIIKNDVRPLIQDLDTIPFADSELYGHFVENDGNLVRLDNTILPKFNIFKHAYATEGIAFPIMTSRGCPFHCTYCCNNFLRKMYPAQRYLRRRSPENVLRELDEVTNKNDDIGFIIFADDDFAAQGSQDLRKFLEEYKRKIGLPFSCSVSPATISEEKMRYLIDAGIYGLQMGIQTGSARMQKLYKRNISIQQSEKAVEIVEKFRSKMPLNQRVRYHFILDNPYETTEDKIQTLEFLLKIPNRRDVSCFSLVLFPGTEIYQQAKDDGLITDERGEVYEKDFEDFQPTWVQYWLRLYQSNIPAAVLRLLLNEKLFEFLDNGNSKWTSATVLGLIRRVLIIQGLVGRIKTFLSRSLLPVRKQQGC